MSNTVNPIDDLIDQIDESSQENSCCKCFSGETNTSKLLKMSCEHLICLACTDTLINTSEYEKCPSCQITISKNLHKLFSEYMVDPKSKLAYYHDIHVGDVLWLYNGNGHNWLYSKQHSQKINTAFEEYESTQNSILSTMEIEIKIGNKIETYVIDFDAQVQYQKTAPNKQREISCFTYKSVADLKKNKIIGIAGKML